MKWLFAIIATLMVSPAFAAGAQSDDVSWTLPTQRVDGTPLPAAEIDRIEFEISRDGVVIATDAYPPNITTFTYARDLPPNYTLCYRARTVDTDGLISDWTSQVCKTVKGKPNPPNVDSVR